MSTEIATRQVGHLTVAADQSAWTTDQELVLRQAGVDDDVTPAELTGFLHLCQRTGLDPFSRQIYLIGRWDGRAQRKVFTPQTSIEGYRVVRDRVIERTHGTLSYDDTLWCGPDGQWRDIWLDDDVPPAAAKVTVYRDGGRFSATAKFSEYVQTTSTGAHTAMWKKMPSGQLAKCAEALVLRKAFPHDLAGVYTAEEMAQADNQAATGEQQRPAVRHLAPVQDEWNTVPGQVIAEQQDRDAEVPQETPGYAEEVEPPRATPEQLTSVLAALKANGINDRKQARAVISAKAGRQVEQPADLTAAEADRVVALLTAPAAAPEQDAEAQPEADGPRQYKLRMMFALIKEKGHTKDGAYALASQVFKREITSAKQLSSDEVDAFIELLKTGELPKSYVPVPVEQPAVEPGDNSANRPGLTDALASQMRAAKTSDELADLSEHMWKHHEAGRLSRADVSKLQDVSLARENELVHEAKAAA